MTNYTGSLFFFWLLGMVGMAPISLLAQVYVLDEVGILEAQEIQHLGQRLEAYEQETGNEIAIRVLDSLDLSQKTIRNYAFELFQDLKIGKKDLNNGILILLAPKNRKVAIEVGYGIEPFISDLMAKAYIEQDMAPFLREENYEAAFLKVVESIRRDLQNAYTLKPHRDSLLIDEMGLLRSDQTRRLRRLVTQYQKETGHSLWIRVVKDQVDDIFSHRLARILFQKLENKEEDFRQTLVFVGVIDKKELTFNYSIIHNWEELARGQIDEDNREVNDYYQNRAQDKICQKLQSDVLDHSFLREKYYQGLKATVDILIKVQNQEMLYSQIKPPSFFLREYGLYILGTIAGGGILLAFFYFGGSGRNQGGKGPGGKGYSGSPYKSWSSSTSSSYGGSSYGGGSSSSGGGSYGSGSFGGGSSGGGGADGSY